MTNARRIAAVAIAVCSLTMLLAPAAYAGKGSTDPYRIKDGGGSTDPYRIKGGGGGSDSGGCTTDCK